MIIVTFIRLINYFDGIEVTLFSVKKVKFIVVKDTNLYLKN